jgi:hypothetical protein
MKKSDLQIPLARLQLNAGQLSWLPKNPRQWTKKQMAKMIASLDEDPDFMEDRPPLVVPLAMEVEGSEDFVVFAGNERTQGEKERKKVTELRCVVYVPETEEDCETIIRRAWKDNGHYADFDWDITANEWDEYVDKLDDWGIPIPSSWSKETNRLSELKFDTPYYQPIRKPEIKLLDCVNLEKFEAKVKALDEYDLTEEQKAVLKLFAYRFIKIDFENVANYYAFNASEEEKKAIERLRLVLTDGTLKGFVEDELLNIMNLTPLDEVEEREEGSEE